MSTPPVDLWPSDIASKTNLRTPVTILKEQASLLGQKTQNLLEADVYSNIEQNTNFTYVFEIVAPALNKYRYQLLAISHKIELYPLIIVSEIVQNGAIKISSESEFIEKLKYIFAHEKTRRVIDALIAQSQM